MTKRTRFSLTDDLNDEYDERLPGATETTDVFGRMLPHPKRRKLNEPPSNDLSNHEELLQRIRSKLQKKGKKNKNSKSLSIQNKLQKITEKQLNNQLKSDKINKESILNNWERDDVNELDYKSDEKIIKSQNTITNIIKQKKEINNRQTIIQSINNNNEEITSVVDNASNNKHILNINKHDQDHFNAIFSKPKLKTQETQERNPINVVNSEKKSVVKNKKSKKKGWRARIKKYQVSQD